MSNQDQYGQKGQSNQFGDDFDSLSDDQKIQRKEQYAQQEGQGSMGQGSQQGQQSGSQFGDDFDSLSDDQKIERKNQYAQQQGGGSTGQYGQQQSANKTGYGSSDQ